MHVDELEIDELLVRRLLAEQFPAWVDLPLRRIEPAGTVNAIFRLGEELSVRLARRAGPTQPESKELEWLPLLAPLLPVEIPVPVAQGRPSADYPWFWAIHSWLEGETLPVEEIDAIQSRFDANAVVTAGWERALAAPPWEGPPIWHHGDLDVRNWLVRDGRITGVIDWSSLGVGDPACDVMVAWKLHSHAALDAFREALPTDDATWERARGWALSQAVAILAYYTPRNNPVLYREAESWLGLVLSEGR